MAWNPGDSAVAAVVNTVGTVLDRILPNQEAKNAAVLELAKLQQNGELEAMKTSLSAILAEAQSADPWTSRARPAFLYVMYVMILASIPMGLLAAFAPEVAAQVADGMKAWLAAIPEAMWGMMGVGYLGYVGARSYDKKQALK